MRTHKRWEALHRVFGFFFVLFVVWGLYRLLSPLPVWLEETVLKGLVFGGGVYWVAVRLEGWSLEQLGITSKRLFEGVMLGVGLGLLMGVVGSWGHFLRYGEQGLAALSVSELGSFFLLALVTAFWEQLVFAGYVVQRLSEVLSEEWVAVFLAGLLFALIHVPALLVQQVGVVQFMAHSLLLLSVGVGAGVLILRTRTLLAPIMAHAMWGVALYLFQ